MFSSVITATMLGLEFHQINVEVDTAPGLPCFQMVGLLSGEVREARDRVRVALKNTGFKLPALCVNINLSPADIRKEGTSYDLPIAIGVLCSLGELRPECLHNTLIIGELGLNGEVRSVRGILPIMRVLMKHDIKRVILPSCNVSEAKLIPGIEIIGVSSLLDAFMFLSCGEIPENNQSNPLIKMSQENSYEDDAEVDFSDVHGQQAIKRAALVAAAGFHHLLMIGPPGAGKTMIARRIPSIMPPLSPEESLEVTSLYSIAGKLCQNDCLITKRPFIAPHHTCTEQALVGGGRIPKPGLISLAHRGILFLDEMTEFNHSTLDTMRQPLEDGYITVSRAYGAYQYPAEFMLVAACNPCPCGFYPDLNKCHCTIPQVKRYINRISGPLLDRIDICCDVESVDLCKPIKEDKSLSSSEMRELIQAARCRQEARFIGTNIHFNSEMNGREAEKYCSLGSHEQLFLQSAFDTLSLSARSFHRILRVARTIADLADSSVITEEHLSEAIFYRTSGSRYWGL